jgi:putative nucleotidyltransferase with HDIG domain
MSADNKKNLIMQAVQETPLMSPSAAQLLQITAAADHETADIIRVVKSDAILTARLLRIVNSAAFNLLYPITSIDRAIAQVGEQMVVGVAIADCTAKLFNKSLDGYEGEKGDLWRHDLLSALAAQAVCKFSRGELSADLAYTGGLLHDIGKAIISEFLKETASKVTEHIDKNETSDYLAAEHEILGIDHAIIGYELAKFWQQPEPLQQMIRYHHSPGQAGEEYRSLVYAVHLGDIIAMMAGCGTGSDTMQYQLDSGYQEYFDFSNNDLEQILLNVLNEFKKVVSAINFDNEESI